MVRTLEYNSGLSFEEAHERYDEVRGAFEEVRRDYSGFFSRFKLDIDEEHHKTLTDCYGVLLPLGHEESVQAQLRSEQRREDTLHCKIGELAMDIAEFLSRFRNTGVKFYRSGGEILD